MSRSSPHITDVYDRQTTLVPDACMPPLVELANPSSYGGRWKHVIDYTLMPPQSTIDKIRETTPPYPAPSDSGYRSGKGTDTDSICSANSTGSSLGISQDFLQDFIVFFADTLIEKAGARGWAQYALAHHSSEDIEERLSTLLKKFAIGLSSSLASLQNSERIDTAHSIQTSQRSRVVLDGATRLVRRYRPKIARYFLDNSIASATSLSDRLRGLGQHLSLMERFGLLSKHGTNEGGTLETPCNIPGDDGMDDDVDEDLLAALGSIQDVLVSCDAFQQLASELGRAFYRDNTCEMENIRNAVSTVVGLQSLPLQYEAQLHVDWDIFAFMHSQYGNIVPVASVVVLTGSALYAQATTCGEYVRKNWPTTGPVFLDLLETALREGGKEIITVNPGLFLPILRLLHMLMSFRFQRLHSKYPNARET